MTRFGVLLLSCLSLLCACSVGSGTPPDGGTTTDGRVIPPRDGAVFDPFDPDAACGYTVVDTEQVPGTLVLVFDQSGSMQDLWSDAVAAINGAFSAMPDELNSGLILFPSGGSDCSVSSTPQVPVGPLSTTRTQIGSTLSGITPNGGATPIFTALRTGWNYLDTLSTPGQRGLILVTDGAENCAEDERDAVIQEAADRLAMDDYLTFVVGLTAAHNDLSTLALNGGTRRNDTCVANCAAQVCSDDTDCPNGAPCFNPADVVLTGLPPNIAALFQSLVGSQDYGQCGCNSNADCVTPQTCEPPDPILSSFIPMPDMCEGDSNCCHYVATNASFQSEFQAALEEIGRRFIDSCIFTVPRGADPSMFHQDYVNVGVTFSGEDRIVLRRSADTSTDSWDYTSSEYIELEIHGAVCDRLLMEAAQVEIVLGCPTILI